MDNPWTALPLEPPYVLESDVEAVRAFNDGALEPRVIHLELIPEPFLGVPDAPVVLLNLNPGFTDDDLSWHEDPEFKAQSLANLAHRASPYPFYLLNPDLRAPGVRWWTRKLRALIERVGLERVASRLLCVELFPYHSRRFGHGALGLPSQEYGFELVRNALGRNAIVVVMRGWKFWRAAVPELEEYPRRFALRSVQNVSITPRNCPEGFDQIVAAIG